MKATDYEQYLDGDYAVCMPFEVHKNDIARTMRSLHTTSISHVQWTSGHLLTRRERNEQLTYNSEQAISSVRGGE